MSGDPPTRVPVLLDVLGKRAVVLGTSDAAESAVERLAAAGAAVTQLTGAGGSDARQRRSTAAGGGPIEVTERGYVRGDLAGASIALCYAEEAEVGPGFSAEARDVGAIVYVAGTPGLSSFEPDWDR